MTVLAGLADGLWSSLIYVTAFLVLLTVIVFVHEAGHFLAARLCGVKVEVFSIGFGPEIWGWNDRHGTRWCLAWIPLGGYVKFFGDENAASVPSHEALSRLSADEREGAFHLKPVGQRAFVVAAGPLANFLLAIVIFTGMFLVFGLTRMEPRVSEVEPGTPAAAAGFQPGDLIKSVDGRQIGDFAELQRIVSASAGRTLTFEVERGGAITVLKAAPQLREHQDRLAGRHARVVIGIRSSPEVAALHREAVTPWRAIALGAGKTWEISAATLSSIGDIFVGQQAANQIGGPIRIAVLSGEMAKLGPEFLIQFIAFMSISIGLINLFPIPLLDGGHLLFYAIEAIRGRPLNKRAQEIGFNVGLALIVSLFLLASYYDFSWLSGP